MQVSPGGYAYLTSMLATLDIPLCLLLEGGYFIESLAQCAYYTVDALINKVKL